MCGNKLLLGALQMRIGLPCISRGYVLYYIFFPSFFLQKSQIIHARLNSDHATKLENS